MEIAHNVSEKVWHCMSSMILLLQNKTKYMRERDTGICSALPTLRYERTSQLHFGESLGVGVGQIEKFYFPFCIYLYLFHFLA